MREEVWRGVELRQDLVGGDTLRTNAIGNLAILFADQTQIRVGRNSTLDRQRGRRAARRQTRSSTSRPAASGRGRPAAAPAST